MMKPGIWLQITAGKGPAECAWAVMRTLERLTEEAVGFDLIVIEIEPGVRPGTAESVLVSIAGDNVEDLAAKWRGTIQWIARSPFRPNHKRKNWFVGIEILQPVDESRFDPRDVTWETMRASGPGGQHVNRTESAVRVTHVKTGLQAAASEERSQHRNRKLALARLAQKLDDQIVDRHNESQAARWRVHQDLQRGNPVRVFREDQP